MLLRLGGVPLLARSDRRRYGARAAPASTSTPGRDGLGDFFIDHGTGVVIGETCNHRRAACKLYQGVTLAGSASRVGERRAAHPSGLRRGTRIVEDDGVAMYGGRDRCWGHVTIGKGAVIGGNVWVTHDVPAGGSVAQARNDEGRGVS